MGHTAAAADSATDSAALSAGLYRADPRRLLVTIGNPISLYVGALPR